MSTDLSRTLRSGVDAEPAGVPAAFDMARVRSRARRRRITRTTARGAVGVGTAAAIALGAVAVDGRRDGVTLPPAVAGAPAGTCGSDEAALRDLPDDDGILLGESYLGDGVLASAPEARVAARLVSAAPEVAIARTRSSVTQTTALPLPERVRVALVRDGRVVAVSVEAPRAVGPETASRSSRGALPIPAVTCDQDGRRGGDRLPQGSYDVWVSLDPAPVTGALSTAAGPWTVELADQRPASGLPRGYPRDAVPVVPGTLAQATVLDAPDGWLVEVEVPADDRLDAALSLLRPRATDVRLSESGQSFTATVPGWSVRVAASTADGVDSVVYQVTRR